MENCLSSNWQISALKTAYCRYYNSLPYLINRSIPLPCNTTAIMKPHQQKCQNMQSPSQFYCKANIIFMLQQKSTHDLRQQLRQAIALKFQEPQQTPKYTLDWKKAELMLTTIDDSGVLGILIQLQKACFKNKIACFHSFFVQQWTIAHPAQLQTTTQQINQLRTNRSKYHRIVGYIKMRQSLLGEITKYSGKGLNNFFDSIDHIRSLNFEIITLIREWKEQWRCENQEPLFYERGGNYLLKINNDNADMINLANFRKTKFISPPNPFFLSEDGNFAGFSEAQRTQIDACVSIISKQRIFDIKLAFQGAVFVTQEPARRIKKVSNLQSSVKVQEFFKQSRMSLEKQVREKRDMHREFEIKKINAFKESVSSSKLRAMKQESQKDVRKQAQERKDRSSIHNMESIKKVEGKKNQLKQSAYNPSASQVRKSQFLFTVGTQKGKQKNQAKAEKFQPKAEKPQTQQFASQKLRQNISKTLLQGRQQLRPSKLVQVHEIKPKIKLIAQKQVILEPAAQTTESNKPQLIPAQQSKATSFYKPIESIAQEGEDGLLPKNLKTSTLQKLKSSTQIGFGRYGPKEPKKNESLEEGLNVSRNRSSRLSESALESYNSKSLSIIKIYRNSLQKSKRKNGEATQAKKVVEQGSGVKQGSLIAPAKEKKYTKLRVKAQLQSEAQLSKIANQLNEKSKISSQVNEKLQQKSKIREQAEQKLKKKQKLISQLQIKIKQLQEEKESKAFPQKNMKRTLLNREKKMRQIQQKILRSKIRDEQSRLKKAKQQEIKLRERQIEAEFNKNKVSLQQTHRKKLSEYKKALLAEQTKIRKCEEAYSGEKKQLTRIEYQLAEKELKEKLLRRIVEEKRRLKEESVLAGQEATVQKLTRELKEREQLEFERYQLMEREHQRMQEVYLALVEHNQVIQREIQQKRNAVQQLQQQRLEEKQQQRQQEMQQRPQEMQQRPQEVQNQTKTQLETQKKVQTQTSPKVQLQSQSKALEKTISAEVQKTQLREQENKEQEQNIDTLKLKVKEQILAEMLRQQELNRIQQEKEEEMRRLKLKKIEQEVAEVLRAEQQKLQLENAQFLAKIQSMKRQIHLLTEYQSEKYLLKPAQLGQNDSEQAFSKDKEGEQEKKVNKDAQKSIQQPSYGIKQTEKQRQEGVQQTQHNIVTKMENQPSFLTQHIEENDANSGQLTSLKLANKEESAGKTTTKRQNHIDKQQEEFEKVIVKPEQDKYIEQQTGVKAHVRQQQILSQTKLKRQAQILQKYTNLQPLLKKAASIMVQDYNLSTFISAFFSSFDKTTREMIPFSKEVLQKNLKTKRGDIYDGAVGWLQQKQKYYLLGSFQCLGSILKKYGGVQIHQTFHLDKANTYQKQTIARKIRQFQKIGFVYQKQLSNTTFSIRFVVVFPSEKVQPPTVFATTLTTTITVQGHREDQQGIKLTHAFSYLFARTLKETYESTRIEDQLSGQGGNFKEAVRKQLEGPLALPKEKGVELSESIASLQMRLVLPFRYYREKERVFYLAASAQHMLEGKYTYLIQATENICIILQPADKETPNFGLGLDLLALQILTKVQNSQKTRDVDLVLPVWSYSTAASLMDCGVSYVMKERMRAQLNISSVSTSFLIKHSFVEIRAPFLFLVCQTSNGLTQRVLHGHLVCEDELTDKLNK